MWVVRDAAGPGTGCVSCWRRYNVSLLHVADLGGGYHGPAWRLPWLLLIGVYLHEDGVMRLSSLSLRSKPTTFSPPSQFALLRTCRTGRNANAVAATDIDDACGRHLLLPGSWHGFVHPLLGHEANPRFGSPGQAAAAPRPRPLLGGAA